MFISSILSIYCNRHSYMFRPLLGICRLYMNLLSSYTACVVFFLAKNNPFPTP